MKLYVFPPSPRAIKVLALSNYLQIECDLVVLDFFKGDQKSAAFATLNPNRRMPVLEDGGLVLWESNAIMFYLAAKKPQARLWPTDVTTQADVLRWLFWEGAHWVPACAPLILEKIKKAAFGGGTPDEKVLADGELATREHARILDNHLRAHSWLAGDHVSIADFSLASWFVAATLAQYPIAEFDAIRRWYRDVRALPGWKESIPHPIYPQDVDVW